MKRRFSLDENVLIYGQKETNEANEPDSTCTDLIHRIIDICHTLVLDMTLWDKYQHQLSRRHQNPDSGMIVAHHAGGQEHYAFVTADKPWHIDWRDINVSLLTVREEGRLQEIQDRWLSEI